MTVWVAWWHINEMRSNCFPWIALFIYIYGTLLIALLESTITLVAFNNKFIREDSSIQDQRNWTFTGCYKLEIDPIRRGSGFVITSPSDHFCRSILRPRMLLIISRLNINLQLVRQSDKYYTSITVSCVALWEWQVSSLNEDRGVQCPNIKPFRQHLIAHSMNQMHIWLYYIAWFTYIYICETFIFILRAYYRHFRVSRNDF